MVIGATALELGDIKTVPVYHSLAGPVVIAMGYNSIIMDRMLQPAPMVVVLGLMLVICVGGLRIHQQVSLKYSFLVWID
ncbi:MAG: hypothetical protein GY784_12275 [Gammaproteobacteria bacterium]|nr:hypothetical protein [Gammaproteobacteria bacterium]